MHRRLSSDPCQRFSAIIIGMMLLGGGCGPNPSEQNAVGLPQNSSPSNQVSSGLPSRTHSVVDVEGTSPLPERPNADDTVNQSILEAQALADAKNWVAALERFRQAAAISPKDEEIRFRMGVCLAAMGLSNEAVLEYQEAIRLLPEYSEAHNNLGSLLIRLGHTDEGITHIRQAVSSNPQNARARNNLGMAWAKQGNLPSAAGEFEEAVRLDPDSIETWVNLANVYLLQHRYSEASIQIERALRLDPQFPPALKAKSRLAAVVR